MSNELYRSQKLGENRNKQYSTVIEIVEATDKGEFITIKGEDGKYYSHWKNQKYQGWESKLRVGEKVSVFVNQKVNLKGQNPWRNISPSLF